MCTKPTLNRDEQLQIALKCANDYESAKKEMLYAVKHLDATLALFIFDDDIADRLRSLYINTHHIPSDITDAVNRADIQ